MKIGIIGPADLAVAWEKHLRPHPSVSEVVIAAQLKEVDAIDACLLIDQGPNRLHSLLETVKKGYHTFLIAPLPTDAQIVEKIYHTAEEANVLLQFSHWPTLAPASKWMNKKIPKPTFIQVSRQIQYSTYKESNHGFDYYWMDEVAFCLRWINGAVHHVDLKKVELSTGMLHALHLFLRFDSGASANIYINAASAVSSHHRVAANNNFILDCDVLEQTVRMGEENGGGNLFFKRQSFDGSKAAELAVMEFIKSIQLKRKMVYNAYHLMELTKVMKKIEKRLARA